MKELLQKILKMNDSKIISSIDLSHLTVHQGDIKGEVVGDMLTTEKGIVGIDVGKITLIEITPVVKESEIDIPF